MIALAEFLGDGDKQNRKVGRNDPCLCGSGRKDKKCCAAN
ncbi:SEC-C metal-binding domain-containing protein [Pseudorhodobacter ferrugineus]